jgi:hypothetical protein
MRISLMATVRGRPTANAMMSATSCALRGGVTAGTGNHGLYEAAQESNLPMGYIGLPFLTTGSARLQ